MDNHVIPSSPNKGFEDIKKVDENGVEYWEARQLLLVLGYVEWRNFEEVLKKAMQACMKSDEMVENHFVGSNKMAEVGSGAMRQIRDYKLDRYACYLIAQNGDSSKPQIALAQTYFAIQTRKQEIFEQLSDADKRLFIRNEVSSYNKKLFKTAKGAGVTHFGAFNNEGYRGLYGMNLPEIEKRKNIKKGELLDRAGSTELAANLFRITQTDEKIKKDNIRGQDAASRTHFMVGGKVRQTIKDIGGKTPEHLPPEKHIREVKKEIKQLKKTEIKKLKYKK